MAFWDSLSGELTVETTTAEPERMFADILREGISVSQVVPADGLTFQFLIRRRDYRRLSAILRRRGNGLKLIRKRGIYWSVKEFCQRPVLLAAFLLLLSASLYLPTRVLFVAVEGNSKLEDRLILAAAEACGIRFGASRKLVRSEKVKNALLAAVPQLQWAGINTSGCVATISVRERILPEKTTDERMVSSQIAERDGYILSATATKGTAHVRPGEAVSKGQLLISGYTDCGICIRASRAEGEILAQTTRQVKAVTPAKFGFPAPEPENRYQISLLIGKKRINLWKDSRISATGCGRMYEEYFVSLPGGFQLPMGIGVDRYWDYELQEVTLSETEARHRLKDFSESYLTRQMIAGQIIQGKPEFSCVNDLYQMEGSYICTEMIGREQREQIGDIHEQRN